MLDRVDKKGENIVLRKMCTPRNKVKEISGMGIRKNSFIMQSDLIK